MTRFTTLNDELYVNGVGLSTIPGIIVEDYPFFATGARRGDSESIPGRRGQLSAARTLDAFTFNIPIGVAPDNLDGSSPTSQNIARTNMIRNLHAVARALNTSGGVVTLERKLQDGETSWVMQEARGEFIAGLAPNLLNPNTGQTELQFVNLDGCWYDKAWTSTSVGAIDVPGQFSTRRIELVLPGAGTLTNATSGTWVTITVGATLKVEDFIATAGIATLRHGGDNAWFVLHPGINTLTWTGTGTPTIRYKAAHV